MDLGIGRDSHRSLGFRSELLRWKRVKWFPGSVYVFLEEFPSNQTRTCQSPKLKGTRTYRSKHQSSLILERVPCIFCKNSPTGKLYRLYCLEDTSKPERSEIYINQYKSMVDSQKQQPHKFLGILHNQTITIGYP